MKDNQIEKNVKSAQRREITEFLIYQKLSRTVKNAHNQEILLKISKDELKHSNLLKDYTKQEVKPNRIQVWLYYLLTKVFGLTFGIKLMERGEDTAQVFYRNLSSSFSWASDIALEEDEHEEQLIQMFDEKRLNYIGSMIRGLNDALVELTGALAGFTLALQESRLIAMAGLITGIAASMSMGGTEYLARRYEASSQAPLRSAIYTGTAYIVTVLFLVLPYLLFVNIYISLGLMIFAAIIIITAFNFYISVAKDMSFWMRFFEMTVLSLGIAAVSFAIGFLVRKILGVDV